MKKVLILFAFTLFMGSNSFAQGGIQFSQDNWSALLARAEKENKLIFMDAYAEWCGPCKMMTKNVFSQKEVGDFYNTKFVNAKIDMEKGEGIGLAKLYGIMAYPTLLFINSQGEVVHRAVGYHATDMFIELGEAALDPLRNFSSIKARYEDGDRTPELLYIYAMAKAEAMEEGYGKIAEEYLATQPNWNTDKNMEFLFRMVDDPRSKMFDFFVSNKKAFTEKFGEEAVAGKVEELIQGSIMHATSEADLKAVDKIYTKIYPEKAAKMSRRLRMGFYAQQEDWNNFAKASINYYDEFPAESWEELNEVAWIFYETVEGKKNLRQALKWANQSVKMESNFYNNDTVAALNYKLGKKKAALKAANKAIELAKASGDDYSGTEELLQKIKAM